MHSPTNDGTPASKKTAEPKSHGELVASCLKDQGFEYWPEEISGQDDTFADNEDPEVALDHAARDGYGVVAPFSELKAAANPDLQGSPDGSASSRRNQEYTSNMSPAMLEAYSQALYGDYWNIASADDPDSPEWSWDWRKAGCEGFAEHQVEVESGEEASQPHGSAAQPGTDDSSPYDDLIEQMASLESTISDAPGFAKIAEKWSLCMADRGFEYDSWDEPEQAFIRKLEEVKAPTNLQPTSSSGDTVFMPEGYSDLPDQKQYEELYALERKVAVADLECQQSIDRAGLELKLLYDLEKEFLDQHRERLDAMKTWFEAQH